MKRNGIVYMTDLNALTFSGTDIAGEVVGLGPGVTNFAVGDKVSSWLGLKKVCLLNGKGDQY